MFISHFFLYWMGNKIGNTWSVVLFHIVNVRVWSRITCGWHCCSDPVSGIKRAEMGLGLSRRDTYVLGWTTIDNYTHIQYSYHIPDGVAVWVKIRVANYGLLSSLFYKYTVLRFNERTWTSCAVCYVSESYIVNSLYVRSA